MSIATVVESDLDMKVLRPEKREHEHGEHGWFQGGSFSFDWLLKHKVVRDWIDSYTAANTRKQKLYQFEKVLAAARIKDPADLLRLSDLEAKNLIKRVAQFYLQQGKASWARQTWITMKGFYEAHDREIKFKRQEKIRVAPRKKVSIESIPLKPDIYRMSDVANTLRNRALVLCAFQSGVRPGCLVNWTYGMVEKQIYPEIQLPIQLKITTKEDTKLAGYGLDYYVTFLSQEAAEALKDYVEERKREGWVPKKSDYLFPPEASTSKGEHLAPGGLWEVVKDCAEKAGLKTEGTWTHLLRKSFRKVLNATPELDEDFKEAVMGHRPPGSRGNYYDYHDVEEAAEKYAKSDWSRNGIGNNGKLKRLEDSNKSLEERVALLENRNKELMIYLLAGKAGVVPTASPERMHQIPTETLETALGQHVARTGREAMQNSAREAPPLYKLGKSVGRKLKSK
jgi:integrase